jgi:small neutral amino acid transporter SnatA (MarC family)
VYSLIPAPAFSLAGAFSLADAKLAVPKKQAAIKAVVIRLVIIMVVFSFGGYFLSDFSFGGEQINAAKK